MTVNPAHDALKRARPVEAKSHTNPKQIPTAAVSTRVKITTPAPRPEHPRVERNQLPQSTPLERPQMVAAASPVPHAPPPAEVVEPMTHPFPRPVPQPNAEPDLIEFTPNEFWQGPDRSVIPKPINLKIIEAYHYARRECSHAWLNKLRDSALHTSKKLIAASKALREELEVIIALSNHSEYTARIAIRNLEVWETLLESHSAKTHDPLTKEARAVFWMFGLYVTARLHETNQHLINTLGLHVNLDNATMRDLVRRVKVVEVDKPGLFSRAMEQTLAHLKEAKAKATSKKGTAEREIPDPAKYPSRVTTAPAVPKAPTPPPAYFDLCDDENLTDLNVNLRAASVAFHLVFMHHEETGHVLPVPRRGKDLSNERPLTEANVPTLVRYLTDHFEDSDPAHIELMDGFFRFFRYILQPPQLLGLLVSRYREKAPKHYSDEDRVRWNTDHVFTKLFIVRIIARWLECYYLHAEDYVILDTLNKFVRQYVVKDEDLPPSAAKLITLQLLECDAGRRGITYMPVLERTIAEGKKNQKVYPETAFQKYLIALQHLKNDKLTRLADITLFHDEGGAEELARTLTRLAAVGFQENMPPDLIFWKSQGNGPWLGQGYMFSHTLAKWVSLSVLDQDSAKNRAKAYEVLVEVAWVCFRMRNFLCAFAITVALGDDRIARLKHTRKYISQKHKDHMRHLQSFFRSNDNGPYIRAMRCPPMPTIPNTAVVVDQLNQMTKGRGFRESILKGEDGVTPIKFDALRSLAGLVKEVERCYIPYEVPVHALIEHWVTSTLNQLEDRDVNEFMREMNELSHMREPDGVPAVAFLQQPADARPVKPRRN